MNYTTSEIDMKLISKIADRFLQLHKDKLYFRKIDIVCDLDMCNSNDIPLDFSKMLNCSNYDLSHDIFGIMANVDRKTGKILNCFSPINKK